MAVAKEEHQPAASILFVFCQINESPREELESLAQGQSVSRDLIAEPEYASRLLLVKVHCMQIHSRERSADNDGFGAD